MLKHTLFLAFRTLRRERGYAVLNVVGLGLGFAAALLLTLHIRHELTFDRFHEHGERIQRVWLEEHSQGEAFINVVTPLPLAERLTATFPAIEEAVAVYAYPGNVERGETRFAERIHLAGPSFFEVFSFPLVRGRAETVLADPSSVVLTTSMARKYFGDADPVGQPIAVQVGSETRAFTVTGLAADPPANSSIRFDVVLPFTRSQGAFGEPAWDAWQQVYPETYVLLAPGVTGAEVEAQLPRLVETVRPDLFAEDAYTFHLQPLHDIHLDRTLPAGIEPTGDPAYPLILTGIAALVLVIGCVNFMTVSVGRSLRRATEVGVRKAIGAQRGQLMRQFWAEAALVTAVALLFGGGLAFLLLPAFNALVGTSLAFTVDPVYGLVALGLGAVVALVAGSYPAVFVSRFRPAEALRNRLRLSGHRSLLRRGLIAGQFFLATLLIVMTLLMAQQFAFMRQMPLGFDQEQVVVVPTTSGMRDGLPLYERVRAGLLVQPGFTGVAAAAFGFNEGWAEIGYDADDDTYRTFKANFTGPGFVETMGIAMVAGRSFSRDVASDAAGALVVNEAFARAYGWSPSEAIGKRLPGPFADHQIIGVTADFHYQSLHSAVEPLVLTPDATLILRGASNVDFPGSSALDLLVRLAPGDVPTALARLEDTWRSLAPDQAFSFAFLDDALDAQYRSEVRLGQVVTVAALLALFIACLGLFALATLATARRTKEMGIRKVLGASVPSLVVLLNREFLALVGVGFALALPVAYLAADRWLSSFSYRAPGSVYPFVAAGVLAVGLALATVSLQSARAARTNPVASLRYE